MFYEPDNIEYVSGRLRGTVIRLAADNTPINVNLIDRNGKEYIVVGFDLENKKENMWPLDKMNLKSPRLGFTNFEGESWYIGRFPMRRDWKQGLRSQNMFAIRENRGGPKPYPFPSYTPLVVPFKDKYPTYKECLEKIEDIYESCAFSPVFSLNKNGKIVYKNVDPVGKDRNGVPALDEEFDWLTEALAEAVK